MTNLHTTRSASPTRRHAATVRVAFAAGLALLLTDTVIAQGSITFNGIARDFLETHPDFNVGASSNQAANVAGAWLDTDFRPVLSGDAWDIAAQWRDDGSNNIPYDFAAFGLPDGRLELVSAPQIDNKGVIDVWDPASGPYDKDAAGAAQVLTGQPMPSITVPSAGLVNAGELLWDGHGSSTLSTSYRCDKFLVKTHHQLHISGDVTVVVEEEFKVENQAAILLDPGATLTFYFLKDATMQDHGFLNANTQDPSRVTIYHMPNLELMMQNQCEVYANIISPNGGMTIQDGSHVFGSYSGSRLLVKNQGGLHLMGSGPWACGFSDDHLGAAGSATGNNVTSAATFNEWFAEVPGVNASKLIGLEMHWQAAGFYEFTTPDFRPIDGELLGVGSLENRHFTFEGMAAFLSGECTGGFIEIECDGEAWVYVNDRRVLDLGAQSVAKTQRINIDRLGLAPNEVQVVSLFYAQRTGGVSGLTIRTNLELFSLQPQLPVSALYD